jgi:kumamolisin
MAGQPILGSEREPIEGAQRIAPADLDEHLDVTIVLRPQQEVDFAALAQGTRLSREEFAGSRSAHPNDVEAVIRFALENGFQVARSSPNRRSVVLSGRAGDLQRAFGVQLGMYQTPDGLTYRGQTGPVNVPASLVDRVVAVEGLDARPQAKPHLIALDMTDDQTEQAQVPQTTAGAYYPPQVAQLYDFPNGDGSGQTIGILEFGGGLRAHDLRAYFRQLGLEPPPALPRIVSVDNGRNWPSTPNSADGEVMLDIEVVSAVAPGAQIVVYFAPNTSRGFVDAVTAAVNDTVNDPQILSISWGGAESTWTTQTVNALNAAFADAAALGVTVYAAAGDNGSSDGQRDGRAHVDFPASSPYVVGCGGSRLTGSGSTISDEVVWQRNGATGGGVSALFPVPTWQQNAGVPPSVNPPGNPGRGVPDVAGDADPATGYRVRVDGRQMVVGGTSAVAPLWAGLTALLNQQLGTSVGFVNPAFYQIAAAAGGAFHDITRGSNGAYHAGPGWDPCTGLGSPSGDALVVALQNLGSGAQAATAPGSPPPGSPPETPAPSETAA